MSAIAGIYHGSKEPINREYIEGIMGNLKQFPADDIQVWHKENVFLGCHAQWITPESVGEQLPFYDYERQLIITADAIIDNRSELFDRLQVEREQRKRMPDSKLIVLAYSKWGEECPKYLVGDFAFIIWDEKKQMLFGARDFSGSRTLYYFYNQQQFAFCTTIQPLLSLSYIKKQLNEQWLAEFLAISGMMDAVDTSITAFKNIRQVPPSHSISVIRDKVQLKRYSPIVTGIPSSLNSDKEYIEAFQEIFDKAVASRIRTDRQVGAQLSGGLDSGAVVSFAAKHMRTMKKQLHTFSYVPTSDFNDFTSKNYIADERPFIKSTVQHIGGINDHYLDFKGRNSFTEIDGFLETMEMPYKFFENSFWLKGMFEKAHEEGVGVLLNGGRGNMSISWGSALDYYAVLFKKMKLLRLYKELDQYSKNTGGARLRRLPAIGRLAFPIFNRLSRDQPFQFPMLINPEFEKRNNVFNKLKEHGIDETGTSIMDPEEDRKRHFEELFHWNASNTIATKLSLRYSLWKRDPTNDIRVIRFCLSVPEEQYVQNGIDRALVRRATEKYLPDKVRLNQSVRGIQGADWVHRMIPNWNEFTDELQQLNNDERIKEYLNPQVMSRALLKVQEGPRAEYAINLDYKILMRSLIVYRFLKKFY
jgi:asparagine synthase (glutamine-hydrolysing)